MLTIHVSPSPATCSVPVGLNDGRIPKDYLTASSMWDANHGPYRARLYHRNVGGTGAWAARYNNAFQWIQVRLLGVTTLTGITTQGRHEANQWVKTYEIATGFDGKKFKFYQVKGKVKVSPFLLSLFSPRHDYCLLVCSFCGPFVRLLVRFFPSLYLLVCFCIMVLFVYLFDYLFFICLFPSLM